MMVRHLILIVGFGLALAGCASRETVILPTTIEMPEGWPVFAQHVFGESECPPISGVYAEYPTQWSTPGSHYKNIIYEQHGYVTVLPFHQTKQNDPVTSEIEFAGGEFAIIQTEPDEFLLLKKSRKGEVSEDVFSLKQGHFRCVNARMMFPLDVVYYADQGGSHNIQYQGVMAIDESGDLVVVRISGPYKSSLLGNSPRIEYDFMKFARVRDS